MEITNGNVARPAALSKSELVKALELDFATTVNKAYINSLDKEVSLREVKVSEQKTLSRIMINNEMRKDIIYDSQCALINSVVLDEDFDIYRLSEFDKIKLLMIIYQSSMLKKQVNFTCKHCGTENSYDMDFQAAIDRLNEIDASDKEFKYSDGKREFTFVISYPKVSRVSMFYKQYIRTHKINEKEKKQQETAINLESSICSSSQSASSLLMESLRRTLTLMLMDHLTLVTFLQYSLMRLSTMTTVFSITSQRNLLERSMTNLKHIIVCNAMKNMKKEQRINRLFYDA